MVGIALIFYFEVLKENEFFATNSNLLIPISLQPCGVNLLIFQLKLFDLRDLGCKDKGIRKSEFVPKTNYLYRFLLIYNFFLCSYKLRFWTDSAKLV